MDEQTTDFLSRSVNLSLEWTQVKKFLRLQTWLTVR